MLAVGGVAAEGVDAVVVGVSRPLLKPLLPLPSKDRSQQCRSKMKTNFRIPARRTLRRRLRRLSRRPRKLHQFLHPRSVRRKAW